MLVGGICATVFLTVRHAATHDAEETLHFLHYVTPMIFFAPLLLASRLVDDRPIQTRGLLIDIAAIVVAGSRMVVMSVPFSGHLVFLTYGLISARTRLLRWIALVLIAHVSVLKLLVWHDPLTWASGAAIGVMLSLLQTQSARFARP